VVELIAEHLPGVGSQILACQKPDSPSQVQQRFVTTDDLLRAFHILRC
jgi:hypothetical protein